MTTSRRGCARRGARSGTIIGVAAVLFLAGCGGSGDGDGSGGSTSTRSSSTTGSTPSTSSTLLSSDPAAVHDRWVGTTWSPTEGQPARPSVDEQPIGLWSVAALCQGTACSYGLDLLTEGTPSGAPPPGQYVLWSSRMLTALPDGRPSWKIVDAVPVLLEEGTTTIVCNDVKDPMISVLGTTPSDLPESGTITADRVWASGPDGAIVTPDPAGYRCEVGQD